ncbi:oxygenase MpaB family protein [Algiphilus aromaticivorans]|uniref:oxygenase MpaB family protein n=1 Tax=Algiphilus aromaticivorans TaxID=382454 RepID=UPI0012EC463B|nr:oxygenase MpaB family protein [Algiphilus aromaticivorans]
MDSSTAPAAPETRSGFIPRRHGADTAGQRKLTAGLRWSIRGDAEPAPERWQAIGEALMHGDPAADALVEWMQAQGMGKAWPLLQRALAQGIEAVPEAPEPMRAFFATVEPLPDWVDPALCARGARVIQELGMSSHYALRDVALMGGYQASALNKPLILTGALDGGTPRRIAETMKWVVAVTADNGLQRFAEGYRGTLHVRVLHAMIRRRLLDRADWSVEEMGLPINQTDMAATFLGFSVVQLLAARLLGVPVTKRDAHAVMHLWKAIAWLIGVDEAWLTDDEQEGRRLLYHITLAQTPPDDSTRQLGRALMEETLGVPYPFPRQLRARFEQARHLSVTRMFVGGKGMRHLGLPAWMPPWYPLVSAPATFGWHLAHRLLPGGRERLARRGRRAHEELVKLHFAGREQGLAAVADGSEASG